MSEQGYSYIVTVNVKHGHGQLLMNSLTMRFYRQGWAPKPEMVSVDAVKVLASMGISVEQINVVDVEVISGGEKE